MKMQVRGQLTDRIKEKSLELFGWIITQEELRLMPYIQYTMVNSQKINPEHINESERKILRVWKDKGFMEGGATGLSITKDFWDRINQIIFLGYVDID